MSERAAFEQWAEDEGFDFCVVTRWSGGYIDASASVAFSVWEAMSSRAQAAERRERELVAAARDMLSIEDFETLMARAESTKGEK